VPDAVPRRDDAFAGTPHPWPFYTALTPRWGQVTIDDPRSHAEGIQRRDRGPNETSVPARGIQKGTGVTCRAYPVPRPHAKSPVSDRPIEPHDGAIGGGGGLEGFHPCGSRHAPLPQEPLRPGRSFNLTDGIRDSVEVVGHSARSPRGPTRHRQEHSATSATP
jgi:hypothetical protein